MTVGTDTWGGHAPSQARTDLPPPPHWRMEAVAGMERPHHLRVAPGRDRIMFLLDRADLGSDVWVMGSEGGAPVRLTVDRPPVAFWEDTPPDWSPDGTRVAYTSEGWVRLVAATGGPSRPVAEAGAPVFMDDGAIVVSHDVSREVTGTSLPTVTEVTRLARVDVADPWLRPLTSPTRDASSPHVTGGRMAYVVHPADDRDRSDLVVLDLDGGAEEVVAGAPSTRVGSPRWSHDGSRLAFLSDDTGWHHVYLWDGEGVTRLTDGVGDHGGLRWSPDDERVVTTRTTRGRTDLVVIDVAEGTGRTLARGGTWSDPDWLDDGSIVAVHEDHATPPRIVGVGPDGAVVVLFDPAPMALRSAPHAALEEVAYQSPDGLEIHAFLLRPRDTSRPVPAVVYPHGGPTSHYGDEWDGYAQYFVDKGYAWLAINFRGSTSYGQGFERANHGVWGVADTADCLAAADHLASLGWVDAERIAIFGASYGSYLALASLVDDPRHRFACGVAKYGDCDILTSWAQGDRVGGEDLERMMGHPSEARAAYRAGSPIHRIDRIARPLLVAHGERDERVHPRQSEELVAALERLGITYEYLTYPTEGHGLLRTGPQLHFYRRLERFLDWYLM